LDWLATVEPLRWFSWTVYNQVVIVKNFKKNRELSFLVVQENGQFFESGISVASEITMSRLHR